MEVKVFKLKEIKLLNGDVLNVKQCCMVQPILPTYGKEGDACIAMNMMKKKIELSIIQV